MLLFLYKGVFFVIKPELEQGTALILEESHGRFKKEKLQIDVKFWEKPELAVSLNGNQIQIQCQETAHYYRGLNLALHHLEENTYETRETVNFQRNGFMLDCSRNAVFTVSKVKSIIHTLAKLGMNVLMLYTEDTYEVPGRPYFGAYRGRYTKAELKEMDAYAKLFGIELVPCIQTLAHLHNALKWPGSTSIKDTADILQVGKTEVYTFIEELLTTVKETFSTRRIHLGMDEAIQLGLGNYLRENGYTKSATLIREHCKKVLSICKKLDLEPMIWSDMYITANTNGGYYDIASNTDCSLWEKPEKELGLVYWDYYHHEKADYEKMLRVHKQLSKQIIFAGGSWIWNGIAPNYSKTFESTKAALETCKKCDIKEVLCTAWMDNGAETPVDAVLPGLALYGYFGFHETYEEEAFKQEFAYATDASLEEFWLLDRFDTLFVTDGQNLAAENPSKYLLYQDPMVGIFDFHVTVLDTHTYYKTLAAQLTTCKEPKYKALFAYYKTLATVLTDKADLGVQIKSAYDKNDSAQLQEFCEVRIPKLLEKLRELKLQRESLWMNDAKPFGFELLDIKLGGVLTRLESTQRRLKMFLEHPETHLEELEAERLRYFIPGSEKRENFWQKIISGCDLMDTV